MSTRFSSLLGIKYPVIMAPMFLVSNTKMVIEALKGGITAALPALNYRTEVELRKAISEVKAATNLPFGINLIVNKSNPNYKAQLKVIVDMEVAFVITSLGNPKKVIEQCKPSGIKVFCDVVDLKYAQKVEALGADALIAVNNMAGGHSGIMPAKTLIAQLKAHCKIPIISAGGVATKPQLLEMLALGADGVSVGTVFIASSECAVNEDYKKAIINYKANDVVMTNKMSGSPLTVINTPFVEKLNKQSGFFEHLLHSNPTIKKLVKMYILMRGKRLMEKAAFKATYKTVWVAGPCIEYVKEELPIKQIIQNLVGSENALDLLKEVS